MITRCVHCLVSSGEWIPPFLLINSAYLFFSLAKAPEIEIVMPVSGLSSWPAYGACKLSLGEANHNGLLKYSIGGKACQ